MIVSVENDIIQDVFIFILVHHDPCNAVLASEGGLDAGVDGAGVEVVVVGQL